MLRTTFHPATPLSQPWLGPEALRPSITAGLPFSNEAFVGRSSQLQQLEKHSVTLIGPFRGKVYKAGRYSSQLETGRMHTLLRKITERSAHVGVIGLGYVGLPLAIEFARAGYRVTGIDTDPDYGES